MGGQATPPADESVLGFEEPPMAGSRTAACAIVREAGPIARDDHGASGVTTSAAADYAPRGHGLPLVFPPGGGGGQ